MGRHLHRCRLHNKIPFFFQSVPALGYHNSKKLQSFVPPLQGHFRFAPALGTHFQNFFKGEVGWGLQRIISYGPGSSPQEVPQTESDSPGSFAAIGAEDPSVFGENLCRIGADIRGGNGEQGILQHKGEGYTPRPGADIGNTQGGRGPFAPQPLCRLEGRLHQRFRIRPGDEDPGIYPEGTPVEFLFPHDVGHGDSLEPLIQAETVPLSVFPRKGIRVGCQKFFSGDSQGVGQENPGI